MYPLRTILLSTLVLGLGCRTPTGSTSVGRTPSLPPRGNLPGDLDPDECLEPEESPFLLLTDHEFLQEKLVVEGLYAGHDYLLNNVLAQVVHLPSFDVPEIAALVRDKGSIDRYAIVSVRISKAAWDKMHIAEKEMVDRGDDRQATRNRKSQMLRDLPVERAEAHLDDVLATRLLEIWERQVSRTRYIPGGRSVLLDGTRYHFAVQKRNSTAEYAGRVHSPRAGTLLHDLAALGHKLIAFPRLLPEKQPAAEGSIRDAAAAIAARVALNRPCEPLPPHVGAPANPPLPSTDGASPRR